MIGRTGHQILVRSNTSHSFCPVMTVKEKPHDEKKKKIRSSLPITEMDSVITMQINEGQQKCRVIVFLLVTHLISDEFPALV